MSRRRQFFGLAFMLVLALGLGYAGWRIKSPSQSGACQACGRAIHDNMRTLAMVGDRREVFCCPACARSAGIQAQEKVRFDQLADYTTGRALRPAAAFAVEGSDVNPCIHSHGMLNPDGQPVPMEFDRCSPSIITFASLRSAESFASEHGGRVDAFLQVVAHHTAASPVP